VDDAVAQANALNRAFAIAQKTDSGTVWVNKHLDLPLDVAFSGAEQSGFGAEVSEEGLEEFKALDRMVVRAEIYFPLVVA
jgi:acyl-CoA reductase-like NAD-dependent aldehyde dehydrogenase